MIDIWAVLTNNTTLSAFPHVIAGSLLTGAVFVAGISLWYLLRRNPSDVDRTGFAWALRFSLWVAVVASAGILVSGHYQSHLMFQQQPMKMAAAEALCNTEAGAGLSIFAIGDVGAECDVRSVVIPGVVAFLATGDAGATIPGVLDVNAASAEKYGEGDYRPSLFITYWGFRGMIGLGFVALGAALFGLWKTRNGRVREFRWAGVLSLAIIPVPFLANSLGWIFTEMGRQPWVVAPNPTGIPEVRLLTRDAVSASVGSGLVLTSLIGFTFVYGVLAVVEVGLLKRYASAGPDAAMPPEPSDDDTFTFAY